MKKHSGMRFTGVLRRWEIEFQVVIGGKSIFSRKKAWAKLTIKLQLYPEFQPITAGKLVSRGSFLVGLGGVMCWRDKRRECVMCIQALIQGLIILERPRTAKCGCIEEKERRWLWDLVCGLVVCGAVYKGKEAVEKTTLIVERFSLPDPFGFPLIRISQLFECGSQPMVTSCL